MYCTGLSGAVVLQTQFEVSAKAEKTALPVKTANIAKITRTRRLILFIAMNPSSLLSLAINQMIVLKVI